jgi:hypothetical protein
MRCQRCDQLAAREPHASAECWCDFGSCGRCGRPYADTQQQHDGECGNCDGPVAQEGAE